MAPALAEAPPEGRLVGLISKKLLAQDLGIAVRTVDTWRAQGLPGVKVGKAVFYDPARVREWMESR